MSAASTLPATAAAASAAPAVASAAANAVVVDAVRDAVKGWDASHDISHIERVRKLAATLAGEEGIVDPVRLQVINLAAFLHDVDDHKYATADTAAAGPNAKARDIMARAGIEAVVVEDVCAIINSVGFSSEIGGAELPAHLKLEASIVQDADRLEAIGAIGIARCLTYGGAKKRALYEAEELDPAHRAALLAMPLDKAQYEKGSSSVAHFYHKLLRLKDMLKTASGRAYAARRHAFMEAFLEQLFAEVEGKA